MEASASSPVVGGVAQAAGSADEPIDRILTVPNIISFLRLCLIPVFIVLLVKDKNVAATAVFAFAALTDCIDGYIARHFNQVSKLGQLLDPTVDRLLMISGAIGLIIVGRLPIWIVVLVLVRDVALLLGGSWLLEKWQIRVPVIYAGKVCTTILFTGFAFLLLNWPLMAGLGWTSVSWLPGFNAAMSSVGIWLVYAGLLLGVFTTSYYVIKGALALRDAKARTRMQTV